MTDEPKLTEPEWLAEMDRRQEALEQQEHERIDREEQARKERKERARAEYLALPAIKRIEHWYSATVGWHISESFNALGAAMNEWAREQQKTPPPK